VRGGGVIHHKGGRKVEPPLPQDDFKEKEKASKKRIMVSKLTDLGGIRKVGGGGRSREEKKKLVGNYREGKDELERLEKKEDPPKFYGKGEKWGTRGKTQKGNRYSKGSHQEREKQRERGSTTATRERKKWGH